MLTVTATDATGSGYPASPKGAKPVHCFVQEVIPVRNSPSVLSDRVRGCTPVLVPAGTPAFVVVPTRALPAHDPDTVVAVRDPSGDLRDLMWTPAADVEVEPVTAHTAPGQRVVMRSAGHVLAQAVQGLRPAAKLGSGPESRDAFAYDFDVSRPFTRADLDELELRMARIIAAGQRFVRRVVDSVPSALHEFAAEPYKLALIDLLRIGGGALTVYDNLDPATGERVWRDLCGGPHVPSTAYLPRLRLTHSTDTRGANQSGLHRIHGTTELPHTSPQRHFSEGDLR